MKSTSVHVKLYIAGQGPHSQLALGRLRAYCAAHPAARYSVEVVDVLRTPERALADGIMLTPTLARISPRPERRVVGALGDERTLDALLGEPRT